MKTSRVKDIQSAEIQLFHEGSDALLTSANLVQCGDLLLGNVTFPAATVDYRIVGVDIDGHPFVTHPESTASFQQVRIEVEGDDLNLEMEPGQTVNIPVMVKIRIHCSPGT